MGAGQDVVTEKKGTNNMKTLSLSLALTLFSAAASAAPLVSNVAFSQGDNGVVTVTYDLAADPGIVLLDILTNGVSVGDAKVTHVVGDVNRKIAPGTGKTIYWSCAKDAPEVEGSTISATVTAYSLDAPPEVLVLDLVNTNSYLFYKSLAALPDGGLDNDIYRTSRLVMKKVPAKGVTFLSGRPGSTTAWLKPFLATFSSDYYMGIYPVTQGQQLLIDGDRHSEFTNSVDSLLRPVDKVHWVDIRYWATWPNGEGVFTHDNVSSSWGFLAKLRRCGLPIDLPTCTEWEYACRAGSQTRFGNGTDNEEGMARMGWYSGNSDGTTHPVGRKDPNDWGFYDMHGNVWEWCLDWFRDEELADRTTVRTDYPGESTSSSNSNYVSARTRRGGSYAATWDTCTSYTPQNNVINKATLGGGYRICVKAVIP